MSLKERITEDMKTAMRARDAARLSTIRLLLAAIKQKEIDERIAVDDDQVLAIIGKLIKQRRESIEQFGQANRQDLVERETFELSVLSAYQPEQASEAAVQAAVADAVAATGAAGPADMGKVMALLKTQLAGRADMAAVSKLVRARLAGS
jgi:hypothetical protein